MTFLATYLSEGEEDRFLNITEKVDLEFAREWRTDRKKKSSPFRSHRDRDQVLHFRERTDRNRACFYRPGDKTKTAKEKAEEREAARFTGVLQKRLEKWNLRQRPPYELKQRGCRLIPDALIELPIQSLLRKQEFEFLSLKILSGSVSPRTGCQTAASYQDAGAFHVVIAREPDSSTLFKQKRGISAVPSIIVEGAKTAKTEKKGDGRTRRYPIEQQFVHHVMTLTETAAGSWQWGWRRKKSVPVIDLIEQILTGKIVYDRVAGGENERWVWIGQQDKENLRLLRKLRERCKELVESRLQLKEEKAQQEQALEAIQAEAGVLKGVLSELNRLQPWAGGEDRQKAPVPGGSEGSPAEYSWSWFLNRIKTAKEFQPPALKPVAGNTDLNKLLEPLRDDPLFASTWFGTTLRCLLRKNDLDRIGDLLQQARAHIKKRLVILKTNQDELKVAIGGLQDQLSQEEEEVKSLVKEKRKLLGHR